MFKALLLKIEPYCVLNVSKDVTNVQTFTADVSCNNLMYFYDKEEICPLVFKKTGHQSFISIIQDQSKLTKILTMSKRTGTVMANKVLAILLLMGGSSCFHFYVIITI